MGSEIALMAARNSALAGHVPPGLIPFLASPNADIIQHRLNWTLRFPLPGPAPDDPHAHRFANLALHASGHNSNESLRNAIQSHIFPNQRHCHKPYLSPRPRPFQWRRPTYARTCSFRPHSRSVAARGSPSGHFSHSPQSIYAPVHPLGSIFVFRWSHQPPPL